MTYAKVGAAVLSVSVSGGGTIVFDWQLDSSGTWISVGPDTNVYNHSSTRYRDIYLQS